MPKRKSPATPRAQDPHRAREARKYDNPIPSREFILELLEAQGAPLNYAELAAALELSGDDDLEALRRRLNAMERDGQLLRNRRNGYCLVNRRDLIAGRVIAHPDGFGFLKPDAGGDDLFMSPRQMRGLMHDDRAVVRVTGIDRRGRREGAVAEVLERNTHQVVGRLRKRGGVRVARQQAADPRGGDPGEGLRRHPERPDGGGRNRRAANSPQPAGRPSRPSAGPDG